jgi:hypothetical protein
MGVQTGDAPMKIATALLFVTVIAGCTKSSESTGASGSTGATMHGTGTGGSDAGRPPSPDAGPMMPALDADIMAQLGAISDANITSSVTKLTSFGTRNTCSDDSPGSQGIGGARDWIKAQFAAIPGLQVILDPFPYAGCTAGPVTRENVVAYKLGAHPNRLIFLGGHYDSRTIDVIDGTSPAPGANDSGSQTALVLEAARVMAGHTFDATLVFVAFAGEEQGLVGSRSLAAGYAKYFQAGATVEAMYNCDIVGGDNTVNDAATLQQFRLYSPGTPREILGPDGTTDDTSPSRGLMRQVAAAGGAYVPSMTIVPKLREDRPGRGGDHEAFIGNSYPGVRFIETVESPDAGTIASHQHSPNDLQMYLTPAYTQRVAQVVVASVASLARAPAPPQAFTVQGGGSAQLTLGWSAPNPSTPVDHYAVAARATTENFYHARVIVPKGATTWAASPSDLGMAAAPSFFVSVAAVDAQGHESLFAYPEYRCDATGCSVQAGSTDVTATN